MPNIFFFVLNHPKKVLFCIALVTSLFALSIVNLKYDFTIEQLFAKDKEETEVYFEFQKDFSREDNDVKIYQTLKVCQRKLFLPCLTVSVATNCQNWPNPRKYKCLGRGELFVCVC